MPGATGLHSPTTGHIGARSHEPSAEPGAARTLQSSGGRKPDTYLKDRIELLGVVHRREQISCVHTDELSRNPSEN